MPWFITTLFCVLLSTSVSATLPNDPELVAKRNAFLDLESRIRSTPARRLDRLIDDIEAMRDYPLFPYLYYQLVNRNIHYRNRKQIEGFLRETQGVPIRNVLLKKWLTYLAKNNYKTLFLQTYEPGLGTELLCRNLHISRVKNGVTPSWYEQVEVIWLSGSSLPDACDPVLHYWRNQGKLNTDLAVKRMGLAGKAGKRSLSRYLTRYAPKNAHYVSELWAKVRRNPALTLTPKRFPFRYPEEDAAIVEWGLKRMSWRKPERVIKAIVQWEKSQKLSPKTLQSIKETLAISLTLDSHAKATEWLQRAASVNASHGLWRWYLINAVKNENWSDVDNIARSAPQVQRTSSEFVYWRARSQEALGNNETANSLLSRLSTQRNYYGFMAAAKLGFSPVLATKDILVDANSATDLLINPQVLRARELFALQKYVDARREWFALLKELSEPQQRAAVHFAHQWGWYDQAIVGALRAGAKEDLNIRFPLAYNDVIEARTRRYNVEPTFALAIARRESSFMEDAVSSANARGLMQILPSTAEYLLKTTSDLPTSFKRSMARRKLRHELLEAETNIEFGLAFLQFLEDKLGDNPALIAAGYNAGWRNVIDWLPEQGSVPLDIWIDAIPFKETREYVKAVLTYQVIYDWHKQQPTNRFASLSERSVSAQ